MYHLKIDQAFKKFSKKHVYLQSMLRDYLFRKEKSGNQKLLLDSYNFKKRFNNQERLGEVKFEKLKTLRSHHFFLLKEQENLKKLTNTEL